MLSYFPIYTFATDVKTILSGNCCCTCSYFLLTGCSQFNRIMKSTDNELKYQAALRYYAEGKYFQSMQLLDELIVAYRATNKAEEVYYYYAKSFYGTGDYVSAAYHFSNFCKTYPSSKYAEECQFLNAYCYYLDSPVYSLDQKSTLDAIQQFQLFINKYPSSEKIPECNKLIDELRFKIETKNFQYAKLFYGWKITGQQLLPLLRWRKPILHQIMLKKACFWH